MFYIRADMADIKVRLGKPGIQMGDQWATYEGGALEADDQKTRPGGMANQVAIGGPASRTDVTVTTQFTDTVAGIAKQFEDAVGTGELSISVAYLKMDGKPERTFTRTGIVKSVSIPDVDVNAGDVAFLTVIGSMNQSSV
jgi:hypothetical protein